MNNNEDIEANLIEIEVDDISKFEEQKKHFQDAVHIELIISEDEALSKNKTGELGLLNEYMIEQNIVLNLMSLQYTEVLKANIENMCKLQLKEVQVIKKMAKHLRDDARRQLKEAEYDDFENCAYALDPCIGGSFDMFLNEPKNSYVRMRLRELLRMHIHEIKPGRNHVFELKVQV